MMRRRNPKFLFLVILTLPVLAADAWIWGYAINVRKDPAYRYRPAGIAELYIPREKMRISGFRILARDRLEIRLAPAAPAHGRWSVRADGQAVPATGSRYPRITLRTGVHSYTLRNTAGPDHTFTVRIDYFSRELYARNNQTIGDTYRLISASLPVGRYRSHPLAAFAGRDISARERREAEKILAREIGIRAGDSDRERVEKIGRFLLTALDSRRGIPAPDLDPSPLGSYRCALAGTSAIWCDQFARIYYLFANAAGVPTRRVSVTGRLDGVVLGAHGFTESLIDGKWAYVDLFTRILEVENGTGTLLNAADLLMLRRVGSTGGITALVFRDGRLQRLPFSTVAPEISHYMAPDAILVYHRPLLPLPGSWNRIHKAARIMLNPDLAFSLATPSGSRYLLTVLLSWSGLLLLLFWLLFFTGRVLRRRRQEKKQ